MFNMLSCLKFMFVCFIFRYEDQPEEKVEDKKSEEKSGKTAEAKKAK